MQLLIAIRQFYEGKSTSPVQAQRKILFSPPNNNVTLFILNKYDCFQYWVVTVTINEAQQCNQNFDQVQNGLLHMVNTQTKRETVG